MTAHNWKPACVGPAGGGVMSYFESTTNLTGVPLDTRCATRSASQFVRRTQPCDSDLDTFPGNGVPWMPYPSLERLIHIVPTGLFGPGLMVNGLGEWTPLKW